MNQNRFKEVTLESVNTVCRYARIGKRTHKGEGYATIICKMWLERSIKRIC